MARLRGDQRYLKPYMRDLVRADDQLLLEGSAEAIETVVHETGLQIVGTPSLDADALESDDVHLVEAVITPTSRLIGRTVAQAMFGRRHSLNLLALARQGRPIRKEILRVRLRAEAPPGRGDELGRRDRARRDEGVVRAQRRARARLPV